MQIPKMPLSHPKDVTTQSNRVRRKVLKSFEMDQILLTATVSNMFLLSVGVTIVTIINTDRILPRKSQNDQLNSHFISYVIQAQLSLHCSADHFV